MVVLGVCNGQFRGPDATHNKNVSVDLKWNPDWGQFGISWLDGKLTNPPTTRDRSALLGYVRWSPPDSALGFQAEYMQGELLGRDIDGWYGQVSYTGLTEGGTAFVKYEEYDPDTAAPFEYDAVHVGYAQHLDANNKVTVQYTNGQHKAPIPDESANQIAAQWQMAFK